MALLKSFLPAQAVVTSSDSPIGDLGNVEYNLAQSFTIPVTKTVDRVMIYVKKSGTITDPITVRIETNGASVPSGTLVDANATQTVTPTSTSYSWIEVQFPAGFSLTGGTKYWIKCTVPSGQSTSNRYDWLRNNLGDAYRGHGQAVQVNGGAWDAEDVAADCCFRVYSTESIANGVTINAHQAVYIQSDNPTVNKNGDAFLTIGEWNGGAQLDRGLFDFDIDGAEIPDGATVSSVTLRVYDEGTDYTNNARDFVVYMLLRAFVNSETTWNKANTSTNWGTAGAANTTTDRESTAVGTLNLPNPPTSGYKEWTLTASKFQDIVDGNFTFRGMLMKTSSESNDMHQFSDDVDANPPQLVITYSTASGAMLLAF